MNRRALFWVLLVLLLAIDQGVKAWARGAMDVSSGIGGKPWPGVFEFTLVYNKGIAFGQLQGYGQLLAPIAIAIACGSVWYSWKHPHESVWNHVTAALLASGALGNLYDRLFSKQGVTDMFWIRVIKFPVFNVADACITVAAGMLILHWLKDAMAQHHDGTKAPQSEPAVETLTSSTE